MNVPVAGAAEATAVLDQFGFETACRKVLDYLQTRVPMEFWTVSRVIDGRQVYLQVTPNPYHLNPADGPAWDESMCQVMWEQDRPRVVPDVSADEPYAARERTLDLPVGAYVGIPLVDADGSLFGTMCGFDSAPQGEALTEAGPLLDLLGDLLSTVMRMDHQASDTARRLEATRLDAETDELTGLRNRRAWQTACAIEEDRHHRLGDHASILMVDLDDLKQVNDSGGHSAGDELLRYAAQVLTASSRSTDVVARLGGDEFGILCPLTTGPQAEVRAARLRAELGAAGVKASVGFATMDQAATLADTQARADRAMYDDKRARR